MYSATPSEAVLERRLKIELSVLRAKENRHTSEIKFIEMKFIAAYPIRKFHCGSFLSKQAAKRSVKQRVDSTA